MVRAWRIGGRDEVAWINGATSVGMTITAAVPPVFARYATVVVPEGDVERTRVDAALVEILSAHTAEQLWWLGYLDTGVADIVCPDAVKVSVYAGWPYVLLEAGVEQALGWRCNADATPWHSALPELLFPADRSWLVSTLWDDDWRCVGGSAVVIEALQQSPDLNTADPGRRAAGGVDVREQPGPGCDAVGDRSNDSAIGTRNERGRSGQGVSGSLGDDLVLGGGHGVGTPSAPHTSASLCSGMPPATNKRSDRWR